MPGPQAASSLSNPTSAQTKYVRELLHAAEPAPPIPVRFFYTSHFAIDDPLSPLPPLLTGAATQHKLPPRPFSEYDNSALDQVWQDLRRKILKHSEEVGRDEKVPSGTRVQDAGSADGSRAAHGDRRLGVSWQEEGLTMGPTARASSTSRRPRTASDRRGHSASRAGHDRSDREEVLQDFLRRPRPSSEIVNPEMAAESFSAELAAAADTTSTTGTPFIRAPSRTKMPTLATQLRKGDQFALSSAAQDEADDLHAPGSSGRTEMDGINDRQARFTEKVPVGISRLHHVVMPQLQMEPIYWSPVHDIAGVVRGTWFYRDTMLPVEVEIANMLEAGYVSLQPWTETWADELNSAVEVGALGEMKVLHRLWPERPRRVGSRPGTARAVEGMGVQNTLSAPEVDPEKEQQETVANAGDLIDVSTGPNGPDNKAAGSAPYGRDGQVRMYRSSGIIYANATDAYILRPNLQPSAYYGRRPLANYIRRGRPIGIPVVRGFDQEAWDRLHPPKKSATAIKARQGVSTSQAGVPPSTRRKLDATLAQSERPQVTDLVLVIHGIGQKLSERMESYHFTHAMNAFRREVNVELGTDAVKTHLRKGMGGIMVLPVNWRLSLSFEDGGYRDDRVDPTSNSYTLKDITPEGLTSIRNIVSDVMLDVPYYLSQEHHPKMITACTREANRIYRLWCLHNPGFAETGRVHLIAHSLGSVMAVDILSRQPTYVPPLTDFTSPEPPTSQELLFNTTSLFACGSPAGFFLLLKKAMLLPRQDRRKPGADMADLPPGVAGPTGVYGCLALDNLYNVINPYDPIAFSMNAAVDADYAAALRPAYIPSSSTSLFAFANPFRAAASAAPPASSESQKPAGMTRLPSTLELETHNFSREEVAERRALLLNDNGQVDYLLRYGGGPLEIQYLTMLSAHSSYWLSRDFARMIVVEVGRPPGRDGTVVSMRAVKKKLQIR